MNRPPRRRVGLAFLSRFPDGAPGGLTHRCTVAARVLPGYPVRPAYVLQNNSFFMTPLLSVPRNQIPRPILNASKRYCRFVRPMCFSGVAAWPRPLRRDLTTPGGAPYDSYYYKTEMPLLEPIKGLLGADAELLFRFPLCLYPAVGAEAAVHGLPDAFPILGSLRYSTMLQEASWLPRPGRAARTKSSPRSNLDASKRYCRIRKADVLSEASPHGRGRYDGF